MHARISLLYARILRVNMHMLRFPTYVDQVVHNLVDVTHHPLEPLRVPCRPRVLETRQRPEDVGPRLCRAADGLVHGTDASASC